MYNNKQEWFKTGFQILTWILIMKILQHYAKVNWKICEDVTKY